MKRALIVVRPCLDAPVTKRKSSDFFVSSVMSSLPQLLVVVVLVVCAPQQPPGIPGTRTTVLTGNNARFEAQEGRRRTRKVIEVRKPTIIC